MPVDRYLRDNRVDSQGNIIQRASTPSQVPVGAGTGGSMTGTLYNTKFIFQETGGMGTFYLVWRGPGGDVSPETATIDFHGTKADVVAGLEALGISDLISVSGTAWQSNSTGLVFEYVGKSLAAGKSKYSQSPNPAFDIAVAGGGAAGTPVVIHDGGPELDTAELINAPFSPELESPRAVVADPGEHSVWNLNFGIAAGDDSDPTGGTFTITVNATTTAAIAYDANEAAIQAAIDAKAALEGNVLVTVNGTGDIDVAAIGDFLLTVMTASIDGSSLTGAMGFTKATDADETTVGAIPSVTYVETGDQVNVKVYDETGLLVFSADDAASPLNLTGLEAGTDYVAHVSTLGASAGTWVNGAGVSKTKRRTSKPTIVAFTTA